MVQIVSEVRRLLVVTREFVLAALDDGFWEGSAIRDTAAALGRI